MKRILVISLLLILITATSEAQDLVKMLNLDSIDMNLNDKPLVCLLTDLELVERKNELQKEIFFNVKKVEEVDDGYLFHFDDNENILSNLFYYILAEKKCCPFFQQDISIGSGNSRIVWKVSGRTGIKEMLRETFEEIKFPEH